MGGPEGGPPYIIWGGLLCNIADAVRARTQPLEIWGGLRGGLRKKRPNFGQHGGAGPPHAPPLRETL